MHGTPAERGKPVILLHREGDRKAYLKCGR